MPPVKRFSSYQALQDATVRVGIERRAACAPIIYANNGLGARRVWTNAGTSFKVELVLFDDPVKLRDAFAAGEIHVGASTLDKLALFTQGLRTDPRAFPRVFQQLGWSDGNVGIVARGAAIKSINQLRAKTVVLPQNAPSELLLLHALSHAGVPLAQVTLKHTGDAASAAAAFQADRSIDACVSEAPALRDLAKASTHRLVVSTRTANRLVAAVCFARADFAGQQPSILAGLARGIFEAATALRAQPNRQQAIEQLAAAFKLSRENIARMLDGAHHASYAENRAFFFDRTNPTSFARTWDTAFELYLQRGKLSTPRVPSEQVNDRSVIKALSSVLGRGGKQKKVANDSSLSHEEAAAAAIKASSDAVLTKTVAIHFFSNSWDLTKTVTKKIGGKRVKVLYDARIPSVLEDIARLVGQYGGARVVIEGHTDGSLKGRVPFSTVQQLSLHRARAVKEALVNGYRIAPGRLAVEGMGWKDPADKDDPHNDAKNRRVQVKVYPRGTDR